jgi:hypothetical protein
MEKVIQAEDGMQHSLPSLTKWVRTGIVLMIITAAIASSPPAASAGRVNQASSNQAPSVYLPMLLSDYEGSTPPTSFDLIDQDLQQGKIDAETALEYKTFAEFDDARLPAAYHASEVGGEAGLFMNEIVAAYPTLSVGAQAILEPFFIPPFQAGSWAAQSGSRFTQSAPSDWAFLSAAGGKARVWYKKADAEMQSKARIVANALTNEVWPTETTLMSREPKLDGAGVQNFVVFDHYRNGWDSTFVPFGGYAGMTVPQTCAPTTSIIYINPALADIGNSTKIGLVETTAHEFMHALEYSFSLAIDPCTEYNWMGEATATWAEDFVYPDHNTEWRLAKTYLRTPQLAINDTYGWRQYGEYLLLYFHTHKYNDPDAVRQAWTNAELMDSLEAFNALGGVEPDQLASLWNREPFETFFKDTDNLDYGVSTAVNTTLTAAGGFKEYDLSDNLKAGGAHFFHYKVDPSVRTITFLNGLTSKISKGPSEYSADDFVYQQDPVSEDDMRGAEVVFMVKYEGLDDPYIFYFPERLDFCQDWLTQRVSEIVVIDANYDMTGRDRILKSTGAPSKILVSSAPCMKLTGTATKTIKFANVTETLSASGLQYEYITYDTLSEEFRLADLITPDIEMRLIGGSASWQISGTDSNGCTYSGSSSFTISKSNGALLALQFQLLPGSRRFLGYDGYAGPDSDAEVSYTVHCPNQNPETVTDSPGYFFMPDGETPVDAGGNLKGSMIFEDYAGSTQFDWNLTPSPLP